MNDTPGTLTRIEPQTVTCLCREAVPKEALLSSFARERLH